MPPRDDDSRRGLLFGTSAYLMWGAFPLYFPLLKPAGTTEILAERMAWSFVTMAAVMLIGPGFAGVRRVLRDRRQLGLLTVAAVLVAANWGVYIYGVNSGHVVESSLGYFINPLFTILLGVVVLAERLRPAQWVAVGIGTLAVAVITVDYGRPPWIALVLAFSFGMYGFCKKKAGVPALDSLVVETAVQFVPAIVAIAIIGGQGSMVFGTKWDTSSLLALSGVITVVPLLCFAAGTRLLPLSVIGLLQFLTPVLQFAVGVGIRHEKLPTAELVGFCLVWVALIVLSADGLRAQHGARRAARAEREAAVVI